MLNGDDLRLDLRSLVLGYTSGDDRLANTIGTSNSLLGLDKNVRNTERILNKKSRNRKSLGEIQNHGRGAGGIHSKY